MTPATPRLRVLSVGGNAVSAFLSWRLQNTNASDVTLVWKSGYDFVAQYGISMKSSLLGNERFRPHAVVRTPEEAAQASKIPFDYVLLCVKALPDVYDLASIIESVVTPQHTCILVNTTHSIGVEEYLEERFSSNVVLSLVCGAELVQQGAAEFEHRGPTAPVWVGWANKNPSIPPSIQKDMAEALAMTLSTANVECLVSLNIRQQQLEKMIGPIAFHPASVLFNNPNLSQLYDQQGVSIMINGIIDELLELAKAYNCEFPEDFRETIINSMRAPSTDGSSSSVMYQDYISRRPMEVETFLGSPLKMAKNMDISLPRLEIVYALLHDRNQKNLKGEGPPSPSINQQPPPRTSSMVGGPMRPPMNGMKNGRMPGRAPSFTGGPGMRRGPYVNGRVNGSVNGFSPNGGQYQRDSVEGPELAEFSHVMLYENGPEAGLQDGSSGSFHDQSGGAGTPSSADLALRERELALKQRELEMREREQHMYMRRGPPMRRPQQRPPPMAAYDDEDVEEDYFDPMGGNPPSGGPTDENIDMMTLTSRRHRKMPSNNFNPQMHGRNRSNVFAKKNRSSSRLMHDIPSPHESIMNNPLMGYSSNRYGNVDRQALEAESRHGSLTNARMDELARGPAGPYQNGRRSSQSPGNQLNGPGRPSPPNGYQNGMRPNNPGGVGPPMMMTGQSPPGVQMRQPIPRHPPGHGNAVAPQQVEQHVGVSTSPPTQTYPPSKSHLLPPQKNALLTESARASARSGESLSTSNAGSINTSAASSSSSLQPQLSGSGGQVQRESAPPPPPHKDFAVRSA